LQTARIGWHRSRRHSWPGCNCSCRIGNQYATTKTASIRVEVDIRPDGTSPHKNWFDRFDAQAAAKIVAARLRIVLFGGGTQRRQQADIDRARELPAQYCAIQRPEKRPADGRQGGETHELIGMALTRDLEKTAVARVERDPALAKALLDEAATLLPADDPETAPLILRDLVNATLGFEQLAQRTDLPSKSLHCMRSPEGNPSMDDLAAIFGAVGSSLQADLKVRTVKADSRDRSAHRHSGISDEASGCQARSFEGVANGRASECKADAALSSVAGGSGTGGASPS